jgi:pyruvate formate lyase activating enzyme
MTLIIGGVQSFSTVDYPGKICAVVFLAGCNLRCHFCHSFPLVIKKHTWREVTEDEIISRFGPKTFLDGVTFTGGEPLLQAKNLIKFMKRIKKAGLLVKLDTNGTLPDKLLEVIPWCDYVALDIKNVLEEKAYFRTVNIKIPGVIKCIKKSIEIIQTSDVFFEVRATVLPKLHPSLSLFLKSVINGIDSNRYTIQQFRPSMGTLNPAFAKESTYTRTEILNGLKEVEKKNVWIVTSEAGFEKIY